MARLRGGGVGDVALEHVVLAGQLGGERLELVGRARGEAERRAAGGERAASARPMPREAPVTNARVPGVICMVAEPITMVRMTTTTPPSPRRSTSRRSSGCRRPVCR